MNGPVVVTIEGNIGAGKTTLVRRLRELWRDHERVVVVEEPVCDWVDQGFLQGMYDGDVGKGEFQHMVLVHRFEQLQRALAQRPVLVVMERSPWSNRHVFATANLAPASLALFDHSWRLVERCIGAVWGVHHVYLVVGVPELRRRVTHRARDGERAISCEYLTDLADRHEAWLGARDTAPVWRIDASGPADAVCRRASVDAIAVVLSTLKKRLEAARARATSPALVRAVVADAEAVRAASDAIRTGAFDGDC